MSITEFSLKRPVTTLMVFACLILIGLISIRLLPLEFLPDVEIPGVFVNIPYPNSSPDEVERLITRPVEEGLGTISGIKRLVSNSGENGANIRLEFKWGDRTSLKALEVQEKIDGIRHLLPDDLERIYITQWSTSDMAILNLRISSYRDLSNAYDMLDRNLKRRLERINGISKVDMYGLEKKEIHIELLTDRLQAHHVDINRLSRLLQESNFTLTAGRITEGNRRYTIRPVGEYRSVEDMENLLVNNSNLRLKDVANISYRLPKQTYGRHLDRRYAIGLDLFKEAGANTVDVTEKIIAEIDQISLLPEMAGIQIFYMDNQAEGIVSSIVELMKSGLLGAVLAMLVLFFFLRQLGSTFIVAISVPFSLLVTLALLYFFGLSLNILTMMGLMLSVGMLVDNAVVVTESIHRYQTRAKDSYSIITSGVKEVAMAITAGTFTTAIVFLPNIVNPRDEISIYLKHVGLTIVFALGASLLIARTVVPLLAARIPHRDTGNKKTLVDRLMVRYRVLLSWLIHHKKTGVMLILALLGSVAVPIQFVKKDLFTQNEDRKIRLHYHINGNYTVEKVEEAVDIMEAYLFENKDALDIQSVYSYFRNNYASSTLILKEKKEATKSIETIKELVREDMPKLAIANPSFEWRRTGGGDESIRVQLVGKSSTELVRLSHEVEWVLSRLEGLTDVRSEAEGGEEEIQIVVDRERARRFGFSTRDIANTVSVAMRGRKLRSYRTPEGEVDVTVKLQETDHTTRQDLQNLAVYNARGESMKLASLATFHSERGPQNIHRENRTTLIGISAGLAKGTTLDEVREQIRETMDRFNFPTGYTWTFGSAFDYEDEAGKIMLVNTLMALALIYFVMAALFESLVFPAAIWSSILFAIIGVWWFFLITSTTFSLMAWIGVLVLMGVVVNNGIVLIDHINHLRNEGLGRTEAILQAGQDRLRPILMTAGTTVLGLVPLCFGTTLIGGDGPPYYPMARAIVGGLAFSTFVTLIILPTIYILLDDMRNWSQRVLRQSRT